MSAILSVKISKNLPFCQSWGLPFCQSNFCTKMFWAARGAPDSNRERFGS